MAKLPIGDLPILTGASVDVDADLLPIVDASATAEGTTKRIAVKELIANTSSFAQSGTGAIAETTAQALQRLVFSGQYSSAANFNTARDALTDTAGVRNLNVGASTVSSNAIISFPSRTASRGQHAIISYDVTFSGTVDPVMGIGYNLAADSTAAEAGEPQIFLNFEGNYNDGSGQNKMEAYTQVEGLSGQTTEVFRPWFISVNRSTRAITNQFFADLHQFFGPDALTATPVLNVYPTHIDFTGGFVNGNFVSITGEAAGQIPSLSFIGADTNVNGNYITKGTGAHIFKTGTGARVGLVIDNTASSVNYLSLTPAVAGSSAQIRATGSDTDIDVYVTPKGTGVLRVSYAAVALGGGAAPTVGTIGGSGPATAGQNAWFQMKDSSGNAFWVPIWR